MGQPDQMAELVLEDGLHDARHTVTTHPHSLRRIEVDVARDVEAGAICRAHALRARLAGDVDAEVRYLVSGRPRDEHRRPAVALTFLLVWLPMRDDRLGG